MVKGMKQTEIGLIPEDWEVKKFTDVFNFLSTASYSRAQLKENGDYGYIHYGDIHTKFHFHIDVEKDLSGFIDKTQLKTYSKIEVGDLIMADASEDYSGIGKAIEVLNVGKDQHLISGLHTFLIRDKVKNTFALGFKGYFHTNPIIKRQYDSLATGLKVYSLSKGSFKNIQIPIPPLPEQEAIAGALSDADAWIESLEQLIAKKRLIKQGAMQELLTPKEGWEVKKFEQVFLKVPSKKYQINSNEYFQVGRYPIVDQGQQKIVGYSDREDKVFFPGNIIVFGDHTRIIKYVNYPFIVGADGVQLLSSLNENIQFLYYLLSDYEIPNTGYNRHFKYLKDFDYHIPSLPEQTRIATILSDMDAELEALEQQLHKARQIKQGMMQELLTGRVRLV